MVEQLQEISEDEAALYDRQIRLWGLDAQKRLRSSKTLVAGLSGLGAEICKNIVLAGIKSLTVLDHANVTAEDSCAQFFVTKDDIGKNRGDCSLNKIQQLNPMVEVTVDTDKVEDKPDDFFLKFDVVCLTSCSSKVATRVNYLCHENNIKFFSGDVSGFFGYMFADLGNHEYAEDVFHNATKEDNKNGSPVAKKAKTEKSTKIVKKTASFVTLETAFNADWTSSANKVRIKRLANSYFVTKIIDDFGNQFGRKPHLSSKNDDVEALLKILDGLTEEVSLEGVDKAFARNCFSELSPVCAIVGGVLAQEIVKAVSQRDRPHDNFFFYNGLTGNGVVESIAG